MNGKRNKSIMIGKVYILPSASNKSLQDFADQFKRANKNLSLRRL